MLRPPRTARCVPFLVALLAVVPAVASGAPGQTARTGDVAHDAGLQWGMDRIGAVEAWDHSTGDGIVIAVIDSGVALEHEDLAPKLIPGVACRGTGGDADACAGSAQDDDGHGSHVAGIAAAATGNGPGISGVAPDAELLPVKVLFKDCPTCEASGDAADVAAGIRWAVDHGADVINLSLGSTTSSVFGDAFVDAVRDAWRRGAVPVVAAGNQFVRTVDFGDAPAVVVSATDRDDRAPSYASGVGNARWAVSAPGGDDGDTPTTCSQRGNPVGILSTYWSADDDAAYACLSGTSMAAPHVSGALAVLLGGGLTPSEAVAALLDTAVDLGAPGRDPVFGAGRIDLAAAARRIVERPATTEPTATPLSTPETTALGSTTSAPPAPGDDFGDTAAPQPFVVPDHDPRWPAPVAAALVVVVGAAAIVLRRRLA